MKDNELDKIQEQRNTEILQIRNDLIFKDLFNEKYMDTVEWAVSKILDCDIDKIKGKVRFQNFKLTKSHITETDKTVDLLVEYNKESILIELNNNYDGVYLRNLLYSFEVILSKYLIGNNYKENISTVILVNLNWHRSKKDSLNIKPKTITNLPYDERDLSKNLLTIINVNLDKYEDISYNETVNEDKFYKLLTISKNKDLEDILEIEKNLTNYTKHLGNLSKDVKFREDFMSQEMNDYLREIERNIRLNDAKNEGIQQKAREIVIELNKKNMPLETIAEVTKLSLEEVKKIIEETK